jgi:hypothetical protein
VTLRQRQTLDAAASDSFNKTTTPIFLPVCAAIPFYIISSYFQMRQCLQLSQCIKQTLQIIKSTNMLKFAANLKTTLQHTEPYLRCQLPQTALHQHSHMLTRTRMPCQCLHMLRGIENKLQHESGVKQPLFTLNWLSGWTMRGWSGEIR